MHFLEIIKGRTIRKVVGGGGGGRRIFSSHDFFFSPSACAGILFCRWNPLHEFFFPDKYCFVCHLLIKMNYFTKELLYFVGFNNN